MKFFQKYPFSLKKAFLLYNFFIFKPNIAKDKENERLYRKTN